MRTLFIIISVASLLFIPIKGNSQEHGCTTFSLIEGSKDFFGRNLDTDAEFGYIFINKRNMSKIAYFDSTSTENKAVWTSKYGSITFNQISCDIPHGGINEKGLVVEHMFYGNSNYPPIDGRPAVISHQWIQYILDNCKTVSEAINMDTIIRISDLEYKFPIHFHLMDSTGDRAIIEFVSNSYTVYSGINYTACALANSSYSYSLSYLSNYIGWGGTNPIPNNVSTSENRFVKAADMVMNYPGSGSVPLIDYSFSILDSVWESTKWQIVYDLDSLCIRYKLLSDPTIRTIYLSNFDFDCDTGTEILEIGDDPGNSSNWLAYSTALNTNLINSSCSLSGFVNTVLGDEADDIAVYPETSSCITTAIEEKSGKNVPVIYPNPTTGLINIKFENIKRIEIINQLGQVVFTGNDNINIDISRYNDGIYFVKITTDYETITAKIIKQ